MKSSYEPRALIRTSEKTERRRRYEVEVNLVTPSKTPSFSSAGRSLPEIYDELSDRMKRLTTKKPGQRRPRIE